MSLTLRSGAPQGQGVGRNTHAAVCAPDCFLVGAAALLCSRDTCSGTALLKATEILPIVYIFKHHPDNIKYYNIQQMVKNNYYSC